MSGSFGYRGVDHQYRAPSALLRSAVVHSPIILQLIETHHFCLERRAQDCGLVFGQPPGDRVEAQLGEGRARQICPWKGLGLTHGAERRLQLASYARDELGRRPFQRSLPKLCRRGC
jgi:hypothetical protein